MNGHTKSTAGFPQPACFPLAHKQPESDPVTSLEGGITMFSQPGIGVEDLAWIHRDQFVHYVELAHALGDPEDWTRFRDELLGALTAAFGLVGRGLNGDRLTPAEHHTLHILDQIRWRHDPATEWPAFFALLWKRRHAIRHDLP